jgi:hypothetical protein
MTRRCHHVCACGAELTCGDADRCAAGARWVCPTCDLDAYDAYLRAQMALSTNTHKETHDEGFGDFLEQVTQG